MSAPVNMPSGKKVTVSLPTRACDCRSTCTYNVTLKTVDSNELEIIRHEMVSTIVRHAAQEGGGGRFRSYNIIKVEKVQNPCLWKKYRNRERALAKDLNYVNQKMLFHGSKSVDNIIRNGFDENKASANGMFGPGIYFAKNSSKSNQYVFGYMGGNGCPAHSNKNCYVCERKILLCRVALGRMLMQKKANKMENPPERYYSVSGEPGVDLQYPEFAVYKGDQAYPEYVITYKIVQ